MVVRFLIILFSAGFVALPSSAQSLELQLEGSSFYSDDPTRREIINPGFSAGLAYNQPIGENFGISFASAYTRGNFWIHNYYDCVVFFQAPDHRYTYNSAITSTIETPVSFYYTLTFPSSKRNVRIRFQAGYFIGRGLQQKTKRSPVGKESPEYQYVNRNVIYKFLHGSKAGVDVQFDLLDKVFASFGFRYQAYLLRRCINRENQGDVIHSPGLTMGVGYVFR